jgi:Uncharacterized protein conserved in bacteria (DUF2066)
MRDRLAAISLFLCLGLTLAVSGHAVPVEALYEATVAGDSTDAGRAPAATEALRQVVVRVTGRSAAWNDASLQGLYAEASRLVQTFRTVAPGQLTVAFDPELVESALAKAGQRLWGRERPQFLVIFDGASAQQSMIRKDVQAAGQIRGIPWTFADSRVDPPAGVREGDPEALRGVAKTFGSDGVLLFKLGGPVATAVWTGPAGDGTATGTPTEVVDVLADRLGSALGVSAAESGRLSVVVHGVADLSAYVAVLGQINALPAVRAVAVESISASAIKLGVMGPSDAAGLRKSAHDGGHFDVADGGGTRSIELVYRP